MAKACEKLLMQYMYKDRATITRQIETTDDIGATVYDLQDVYTDVPCKLGQLGQSSTQGMQTERQFVSTDNYRLSLPKDYEVMANDLIRVLHRGQTFMLRADSAFRYSTHQEVSVRRIKDAGEDHEF